MKLADLRRVAVKKNLRIRFVLPNGLECVLDEHGVARLPAQRATADFNLETQLAGVERFTLEPAAAAKGAARPETLSREALAALAAPAHARAAAREEED